MATIHPVLDRDPLQTWQRASWLWIAIRFAARN
jgi:hypothetical protein